MNLTSESLAIGMKVTCRADGSFLRGVIAVNGTKDRLFVNAKPDSEPRFGRKKAPAFDVYMASFGGSTWSLPNINVETLKAAIVQAEQISEQENARMSSRQQPNIKRG